MLRKRSSSLPLSRVRDLPLLADRAKGDKDKMIANIQVIVLDMDDLNANTASYASVFIADESGAATMLLKRSLVQCLNCGDIVYVESAALIFHNTHLVVSLSPNGRIERLGEYTMLFKQAPNVSSYVYTKDASGMMVQWMHVFYTIMIVCPRYWTESPSLLLDDVGFASFFILQDFCIIML